MCVCRNLRTIFSSNRFFVLCCNGILSVKIERLWNSTCNRLDFQENAKVCKRCAIIIAKSSLPACSRNNNERKTVGATIKPHTHTHTPARIIIISFFFSYAHRIVVLHTFTRAFLSVSNVERFSDIAHNTMRAFTSHYYYEMHQRSSSLVIKKFGYINRQLKRIIVGGNGTAASCECRDTLSAYIQYKCGFIQLPLSRSLDYRLLIAYRIK